MSRKEKEVFVRMSEVDLRAREYIREVMGEEGDEEMNEREKEEEENNS